MRNGILAGLLAATLAAGAAHAGDLGGKAEMGDLEERVAELEATVAKKGNRKVSLTISGQVSRSVLWASSGSETETLMIDNVNSPSAVRFVGEAKMGKDWSAGFLVELGIGSFDDKLLQAGEEVGIRHSAVWLGSQAGKLWLGHTSTATDGIVEINLANGVNVGALPLASWVGYDGARQQVIKYVSPSFAGVEMAASFTGENNTSLTGDTAWDVALRYVGEFSGIRLAAGVGYAHLGAPTLLSDDITRISGSASIMHVATGVFLSANAGRMDGIMSGDPAIYGATAGVERNFFGIGATTVFAEYSKAEDVFLVYPHIPVILGFADKVDLYGVGINQKVDALGADLFLNYRRLGIEDADIDLVLGGLRVTF